MVVPSNQEYSNGKCLSCGLTQAGYVKKCAKWGVIVILWVFLFYGFLSLYCCEDTPFLIQIGRQTTFSEPEPNKSSLVAIDPPPFTRKVSPRQHVYYLKTHKTGSTTMYSILAEYCRARDLIPLLPASGHVHINLQPPFDSKQVMLDPRVQKYDMVFNHHVYTNAIFRYLHNDTFRFTTIREPFKHFVSSFEFFRSTGEFPYLKRVQGEDPLSEFLAHPEKYEVPGYGSYTNNRQSLDLGYSARRSFNDTQYIKAFLAQTEANFDLILVTDYFHESLILLKRKLNWDTGDILYYKKLARHDKKEENQTKLAIQRAQHKKFSTADIELYNHFLPIFKEKVAAEEGLGLAGEVKEFEDILDKVHTFCDAKNVDKKQLIIPAGRWSDEIILLRSKCKWLRLKEVDFTRHLQATQKELLKV